MRRVSWLFVALAALSSPVPAEDGGHEYKLLTTSKMPTMEKELNEAAELGYRFEAVIRGEKAFGGKEVVSILSRPVGTTSGGRFQYKLCVTNKRDVMQKEMNEAAEAGYVYRDQTVTETILDGRKVLVILERDRDQAGRRTEYKLLTTNKAAAMQKELVDVAAAGFRFRGVSIAQSAFGGHEVMVVTEKMSARPEAAAAGAE
jgi:hypothetical protein